MQIFDNLDGQIFESYQPFQDFFTTNSQGWIVPDIDRCKLLRRYRAVVANCSTEHWGSAVCFRLHDIFQICDVKNFVILTHDPGLESLSHKILYFPFWFWMRSKMQLTCPDVSSRPNHWISSLSGQPRPFRIANYLALLSKSYKAKCILNIWHGDIEPTGYDEGLNLTEHENIQWQNIKKNAKIFVDDEFDNLGIVHPAWSHTCLNLVNESTVKSRIFLTEKTWKPILSGQMFVVLGNAGIIAELRRLGFDVFDDIIDHTYDLELEARCRLNRLHIEIDNLASPDLLEKTMTIKHRRYENWIKFREHKFVDSCLESIKNLLSL